MQYRIKLCSSRNSQWCAKAKRMNFLGEMTQDQIENVQSQILKIMREDAFDTVGFISQYVSTASKTEILEALFLLEENGKVRRHSGFPLSFIKVPNNGTV